MTFWLFHSCNMSKKSYSIAPNMILHDGKVHTTPKNVANAINAAFLDKVKKLGQKIPNETNVCPLVRLKRYLSKKDKPQAQFELKPIDKYQLRKLLKKRKANRSCGTDFIDGYSIKLAAPIIEDILLHLVNLSLLSSKFLMSWKINKVSPHFKKGDRMLGENWRPVTDIVFVSKLVEAAVYEQVDQYFTCNDLWHPNHHGFKAYHSTLFIRTDPSQRVLMVFGNSASLRGRKRLCFGG